MTYLLNPIGTVEALVSISQTIFRVRHPHEQPTPALLNAIVEEVNGDLVLVGTEGDMTAALRELCRRYCLEVK